MSRFIATYDISDDGQRTRVARVLDRYGTRLQFSVFEVWLDPDELVELRRQVGPLLAELDEFEIIPIDVAPHRHRWRWGGESPDDFAAVVVLVPVSHFLGRRLLSVKSGQPRKIW